MGRDLHLPAARRPAARLFTAMGAFCGLILVSCAPGPDTVELHSGPLGYPNAEDLPPVPEASVYGPVLPREAYRYPGPEDRDELDDSERAAKRAEIRRLEQRLSQLRRRADRSGRADRRLSDPVEGPGRAIDNAIEGRIRDLERELRAGR